MIIGQAPGTKVHDSGIPWNDKSGDRLREWLGIDADVFYDEARIAIVPMGFCFPGQDSKGGDLPPRPECAPAWHPQLLALLPKVDLTLLVGQYAQARYLGAQRKDTLTDTVKAWRDYGPNYMPLPHPSWRNTGWLKKNPWFEKDLLPVLRKRVAQFLKN
jgi:uracil-DNA glycosylase